MKYPPEVHNLVILVIMITLACWLYHLLIQFGKLFKLHRAMRDQRVTFLRGIGTGNFSFSQLMFFLFILIVEWIISLRYLRL